MTAVEVRSVSVTLDRTPILRGVDVDVGPGEWVTVIGPNGAGKSTLLRAVGALLPFTGLIRLFGTPVAQLRRRDRARVVAMVPQIPVVPVGMTVFDYVMLGRTPYLPPLGRESAVDVAVARDVIGQLDLASLVDRPLQTLSGGERQRAVLGRALAQGATLLLLDEPTTALDIGHQQDVLDLVDALRRERGLTVLTSMHDLSLAGAYAQRLVLLVAGRIVAAGPPAQVLTEETLAIHYRARVRVINDDNGPVVVPVRR